MEVLEEVLKLFGATKVSEIIESIKEIEVKKGEEIRGEKGHNELYIRLKPNTVASNASDKDIPTRVRLEKLLKFLNSGLHEKEEAVRLALLSAIAGESIFFLGPPGTAKSMIASRIRMAFKEDTKYFSYLMNEFSTPDEIFGTIKLKGLDEGIYERNTEGFLPEAEIAFLDEIWKSGPAILNTLLTIINEKKFRNGNKTDDVPLQALLAASNELPKEKAGLEALYDRFVIRTIVNPVEKEENFFNLCESQNEDMKIPENLKPCLVSREEINSKRKEEIHKIDVDEKIQEVISEIRRELEVRNAQKEREEKERFYVSDRRWKKIWNILKTSAFLCGRDSVDLMDCQLISYCIWNTAKQKDEAREIVKEIVGQRGLEFTTKIGDIEDEIEKFKKNIDETWYKRTAKKTHEEPVIVKHDGENYLKLKQNRDNIAYISGYGVQLVNEHEIINTNASRAYGYGPTFKPLGNYLAYNTEIDTEKNIIVDYGNNALYEIETKTIVDAPGGLVKRTDRFDEPIYSTLKDKSDELFQTISYSIEEERKKLLALKAETEKPYDENLFADPSFKEILSLKIEEGKKKLEDAQVELEKQQHRYDN